LPEALPKAGALPRPFCRSKMYTVSSGRAIPSFLLATLAMVLLSARSNVTSLSKSLILRVRLSFSFVIEARFFSSTSFSLNPCCPIRTPTEVTTKKIMGSRMYLMAHPMIGFTEKILAVEYAGAFDCQQGSSLFRRRLIPQNQEIFKLVIGDWRSLADIAGQKAHHSFRAHVRGRHETSAEQLDGQSGGAPRKLNPTPSEC
jgi:hypothetical protein